MLVSFIEQGGGGSEEVKQKGHSSCKTGEDVLISPLLQPFTGGQGQNISL